MRSVRPKETHLTERNDREDFAVIPNTIGMHATVIAVCFDESTSIETVLGGTSITVLPVIGWRVSQHGRVGEPILPGDLEETETAFLNLSDGRYLEMPIGVACNDMRQAIERALSNCADRLHEKGEQVRRSPDAAVYHAR